MSVNEFIWLMVMKMNAQKWLLCSALAFGGGTAASAATLDGMSIDVSSPHGSCFSVSVGAGNECEIYDNEAGDDNGVLVDVTSNGILFSFVDYEANPSKYWDFAPFQFDIVVSGLQGFTMTSYSYTEFGFSETSLLSAVQTAAGEITVDFDDKYFDGGCQNGYLCATLEVFGTVEDQPMSPVPLPAALPMLLAGLGGFGVIRRLRRKAD
ncbi:putative secreted protein [Primorskyibacter sedentarius]|uniref:Putative secreted protein n=1 Tax=Primorskyibacter sedentarius TaxID=745311 RepID=A0A4R3JGA3_9RHOB|nr:putative secreted protein [Primorskyibacter sedentarius]